MNYCYLISPSYNISSQNIISANALVKQAEKQHDFQHLSEECALQANALPYCQGYLFFNNKHPSSLTHQFIAEYIQDRLKNNH